MATRSFTVFQDTPSSSDAVIVSKPVRASSRVLARSATKASTSSNHLPGSLNELAVAIDKENYNPLTGLRASVTASKSEKLKRKTTNQTQSVLAPKAHVSTSTSTKKLKTSVSGREATEPEAKKRRTLTASTAASRAKATKKEGSGLGSAKAPTRASSSSTQGQKIKRTSSSPPVRKASSPLPKVDEEDGVVAGTGTSEPVAKLGLENFSQAAIDSRCYELTVSPLADVSEAYEASPVSFEPVEANKPPISNPKPEEDIFRTVREPSAEPELRDYFTVDTLNAVFASSTSRVRSARPSEEPEEKTVAADFVSFLHPGTTEALHELHVLEPIAVG
ncbi:hypothetical protein FA13DRAFT_1417755 [Coprinellus micaceus]|uniref:Uncharacterized protein n=1 Tax=Coprinellus micaceus TaxID=71717 RepID=A0A4Y7SNB1_COPMI|nr:hypothetical protein FA13DRAFT_1417755 [Coprinellus micaceus]